MKSQLTIAGLVFAGLVATGCSQQQASQQSTPEVAAVTTTTTEVAPAVVAQPPAVVRPVQPAPVMPRVKAKGHYKGAVAMDANSRAALSQYQK